jgi:hypothetical protein
VSRELQAQGAAEITRVATDGTPNAASMTIAALTRAALALGYRRIVTYTLLGESGHSYKVSGYWPTYIDRRIRDWDTPGRRRRPHLQTGPKVRWEFGPGAAPRSSEAEVRARVGTIDLPRRALPADC